MTFGFVATALRRGADMDPRGRLVT